MAISMSLAILLCILSIRILPVHGNTLKTNITNSLKFPQLTFKMSEEEPFLTLYNLAVKDCVYECTVRPACEAVNYWRVRRQCDLLESNTTILSDSPPGRPCVYIRKSDVRESPDMQLSSLCQGSCEHNQVCDVETGNCTISECRTLTRQSIANLTGNPGNQPSIGIITGNVLSVGSMIRVSCKKWFKPENYMYMRCESDGNWNITTPCEFRFECGLPPDHPNALASTHDYEASEHVVVYECLSGYAASAAYSDMTIACVPDGSNSLWEGPGFTCLKNCSQPPVIENATVSVGDTLAGTTRNYTCIPGHFVNVTKPMFTTCQQNGTWTTLEFQCIPKCGFPPEQANAFATHEVNAHVVVYECLSGYAAPAAHSDMTITCVPDGVSNFMWEEPGFTCLKNCSQPPAIENATVSVGDMLEGTTRNYACIPGHFVNGTKPMFTTCQQNGTWTTLEFQCIPDICPPDWYNIENSCYLVPITSLISATDMETFCQDHINADSYMVETETPEETQAVRLFLQNYSAAVYCLGLHDPAHDNNWEWMTTGQSVALGDPGWCTGQPNSDSEFFAAMFLNCGLQWKDFAPSQCQPVCELSLQ